MAALTSSENAFHGRSLKKRSAHALSIDRKQTFHTSVLFALDSPMSISSVPDLRTGSSGPAQAWNNWVMELCFPEERGCRLTGL